MDVVRRCGVWRLCEFSLLLFYFILLGRRETRRKRETIYRRTSSILSQEEVWIRYLRESSRIDYYSVPCLRRAASLAYTDADEDAERLLSFGEGSAAAGAGDEWVETHTGRKSARDSADNAGVIDDIPDLDGPSESATSAMAKMSLASGGNAPVGGDTPDLDEIPDMEEELEGEEDEATAAPPKLPPKGTAVK